jgi:hypothetical protein
MKVTKEWLAEQDDLYLTELGVLILREKARREQPIERFKRQIEAQIKQVKVTI